MRQGLRLSAVLLILFATPLWAHGAGSEQASEPTNAFCPVTIGEPVVADIHADYRGRRVYFCCTGCRQRFSNDPRRYVQNLTQTVSTSEQPAHAGHDHGAESTESHRGGRPRLFDFAGRMHPLAVHFPIALLLTALVTELIGWRTGVTRYRDSTDIMLILGAPAAIIAAVLGWSAATAASHPAAGGMLDLHRSLGIASALTALLALILLRWRHRMLLIATGAILVGATGYFGGVLVYGAEHFRW